MKEDATTTLHPMSNDVIHRIVLDYLVHSGHLHAARAFAREVQETKSIPTLTPQASDAVWKRTHVYNAIMQGRIDDAMDLCTEAFPRAVQAQPELTSVSISASAAAMADTDGSLDAAIVWIHMHIQRYIETIRALYDTHDQNKYVDVALQQIHELQTLMHALPHSTRDAYLTHELPRLVALLAYEDSEDIPDPTLLDIERRMGVAEQVNSAILASLDMPAHSLLSRTLTHTLDTWTRLQGKRILVKRGDPASDLVAHGESTEDQHFVVPELTVEHFL